MQTNGSIHTTVRVYRGALELLFALLPSFAILYLHLFATDAAPLKSLLIHELAILLSILIGAFVAYITWRCYLVSGEPFLRWLALGFLGFTLVYLPHGLLTRLADHNMALFLLYGPAARLTLMACLLIALAQRGHSNDSESQRAKPGFWIIGVLLFLLVDALVAALALSSYSTTIWPRVLLESAALALMFAAILTLLIRRADSPLLRIYLIAVTTFAQSSIAFLLLAKAWDHQWWLAHAIFAAGFFMLSYGVAQAYLASGSFISVYSLEEIFEQLRQEKARAEDALSRLQQANLNLRVIATTDALTGLSNRRHFTEQAERVIERAVFENAPLSLLMLDLDHFKRINDTFGHPAGDRVLRRFAEILQREVRPGDLCGRFGGEEFLVLLPSANMAEARTVAERLRQSVAAEAIDLGEQETRITVSIGIAHLGSSADNLHSLLQRADRRLYAAKAAGRNRVHDSDAVASGELKRPHEAG